MPKSDFPYLPVALTVGALGGLLYLAINPKKKEEDKSKIPVEKTTGLTGPLASITTGMTFLADVSNTLVARDPATKVPNSVFTALGPVDQAGVYQGFPAFVKAIHNISGEVVDVPVEAIKSIGGMPAAPGGNLPIASTAPLPLGEPYEQYLQPTGAATASQLLAQGRSPSDIAREMMSRVPGASSFGAVTGGYPGPYGYMPY